MASSNKTGSGLVSMKEKPEKKSKQAADVAAIDRSGGYSYRHQISLNTEDMNKLGMDKTPRVGDKVHVHAHGVISSVSANEHQMGKPEHRVEIQLQKMRVGKGAPGSMEEALDHGVDEADA